MGNPSLTKFNIISAQTENNFLYIIVFRRNMVFVKISNIASFLGTWLKFVVNENSFNKVVNNMLGFWVVILNRFKTF